MALLNPCMNFQFCFVLRGEGAKCLHVKSYESVMQCLYPKYVSDSVQVLIQVQMGLSQKSLTGIQKLFLIRVPMNPQKNFKVHFYRVQSGKITVCKELFRQIGFYVRLVTVRRRLICQALKLIKGEHFETKSCSCCKISLIYGILYHGFPSYTYIHCKIVNF